MNSQLQRLRKELESALAVATPAQLANTPEGKWSPALVLEHLWLIYKNTNKGIAKCLEKGMPLATAATLSHRVRTFVVVGLQYLPGGAKAPERATPRGEPASEVLSSVFPEIQQMDTGFAECERRFGSATKILDHPFLGPLTADQWRTLSLGARSPSRPADSRTAGKSLILNQKQSATK
jgi:hypothetical protein